MQLLVLAVGKRRIRGRDGRVRSDQSPKCLMDGRNGKRITRRRRRAESMVVWNMCRISK